MMQEDVLAILRASSAPMTVVEILQAGDGERDLKYVRKSLKKLERYDLVRKVGTRPSHVPGAYYALWEASQ